MAGKRHKVVYRRIGPLLACVQRAERRNECRNEWRTKTMRTIMITGVALALFALSGCATGPRYALQKGSTVADGMRAIAVCRSEAVTTFPQTVALSNPFFVAAALATVNVRQTYIDDCMDARGFHLCGSQECRAPPTS
jgi:hypothetical protein